MCNAGIVLLSQKYKRVSDDKELEKSEGNDLFLFVC